MDEVCKNCEEHIDDCKCIKCKDCDDVNDIEDNGCCALCNQVHADFVETIRTIE